MLFLHKKLFCSLITGKQASPILVPSILSIISMLTFFTRPWPLGGEGDSDY